MSEALQLLQQQVLGMQLQMVKDRQHMQQHMATERQQLQQVRADFKILTIFNILTKLISNRLKSTNLVYDNQIIILF